MKRRPFPSNFRPDVYPGQVWRGTNGAYIWITGPLYDTKKKKFSSDRFYGLDLERGTQYVLGEYGCTPDDQVHTTVVQEAAGLRVTTVPEMRLTTYLGEMEPPRFVGNQFARNLAHSKRHLTHAAAIQNLANQHGHIHAAQRQPGSVAEFENFYKPSLVEEHNAREDERLGISYEK